MKDTKYELLVVIANQGYTEMIMEAARKASATGGTVLHAKGTGMEKPRPFSAFPLAQEKEMIFLVVKKRSEKPDHARGHGGSGAKQQGEIHRILSSGYGNRRHALDRRYHLSGARKPRFNGTAPGAFHNRSPAFLRAPDGCRAPPRSRPGPQGYSRRSGWLTAGGRRQSRSYPPSDCAWPPGSDVPSGYPRWRWPHPGSASAFS